METITLKQAIEQGYEKYGYAHDGWQSLKDLKDLTEEEITKDDLCLAEKEKRYLSVSSDTIRDSIIDDLYNQEQEVGMDDDMAEDLLKDFDWENELSAVVDKINDRLQKRGYWMLTNIHIVPND